MDQDETRTLWEKGQEAWNTWALGILQRKQALEESGSWSVDWFGEGQNTETKTWLSEAKADFEGIEFATDASFADLVFPGPAVFDRAHFIGKADFASANFANTAHLQAARFDGDTVFTQAKFYDLANFDEASFASPVNFEKAEFLRETTGPLVPAARFQKTQFGSRADYRMAKFVGNAEFVRARFSASARFDEAEFLAGATFESATFEGTAGLMKTRFQGAATFLQTRFQGEARLGEAEFHGVANFEDASFCAKATFREAKFSGDTTFQNALFGEAARFNEANFAATVIFRSTKFSDRAEFCGAVFAKPVDFLGCKFSQDTDFEKAVFAEPAEFPSAKFKKSVSFSNARFVDRANFLQAVFRGRASFRNVAFEGPVAFSALQCRAPFVMSGAHFVQVPNFQDASFSEPPSLDNMSIADPVSLWPARGGEGKTDPRSWLSRGIKACGDPEYAARYRRLCKLASDTRDHEREREFFAQELRCRRFWQDKPFGQGMTRFWIGWLYGGLSDFGRSLSRPILFWIASIFVFSLIYLGQRRSEFFATAPGLIASVGPIFPAWPAEPDALAIVQWAGSALWWLIMSVLNLFAGGGCISGDSGATGEALFLSLKNSLLFLNWESADASRRVYSCLYGFEILPGVGELVRVPLAVSLTAVAQNALGAIFILLFLIALRNLLRAR